MTASDIDWLAQCDEVAAGVTQPREGYRIVHLTADNRWLVEAAEVWIYVGERGWPHRKSQQIIDRVRARGISTGYLTTEPLRADIRWGQIGPTNPAGDVVNFSVFDEAAAWLKAFLKPVSDVVYFDRDGVPVEHVP